MGKKRIAQLLEQFEDNQQQDLQNAAKIFTVAQVAVNGLSSRDADTSVATPTLALPPSPVELNKAELLQRYGSYNECRKAAKAQGIRFSRSPSWSQLVAAFSYAESLKQLVHTYIQQYPASELQGISLELPLS